MKIIVCCRDDIPTLERGDIIAVHEDNEFEGVEVGLFNILDHKRMKRKKYLGFTPFMIVTLPLSSVEEVTELMAESHLVTAAKGIEYAGRKWKVNVTVLEQRAARDYDEEDNTPTKARWERVLPGKKKMVKVRRDTLTAYNEIIRPDLKIQDILIERKPEYTHVD